MEKIPSTEDSSLDMVISYFKVPSQNSPVEIQRTHEVPQTEYTRSKFELIPNTSLGPL
jgi:hypothetical protein